MLEKIGMKILFVCGVTCTVFATAACGWIVVNGIRHDIQEKKQK